MAAPKHKKMNHTQHYTEYAVATAKLSPPITVAAATVAGASLQDWVLAATFVYTVLQIILLVRKTWKEHKKQKEA